MARKGEDALTAAEMRRLEAIASVHRALRQASDSWSEVHRAIRQAQIMLNEQKNMIEERAAQRVRYIERKRNR